MTNQKNLPYMPLYTGDWEKDCNVLSLEAEAAWLRIIFKMFNNGKQSSYKIATKSLQNLWRVTEEKAICIIEEFTDNNICGIEIEERFVIFTSRRYEKEKIVSEIRRKAVSNRKDRTNEIQNTYKTDTKDLQNTEYEYEDDIDINIDIKDNINIKEKGVTGEKDVVPEETTNTPEETTPENKVSEDAYKDEFESFRKKYHGSKRGIITEFENFKKKHSDYKEVVFLLNPALKALRTWRDLKRAEGQFVPGYANLSTWINQRRWEVEHEKITPNGTYRKDTESEQRKHHISTEAARISTANA